MSIYIARQGQRVGPFSKEQLGKLLASGELSGSDLVWHEGLSSWQPLEQARMLLQSIIPNSSAPQIAVEVGREVVREKHQEEPAPSHAGVSIGNITSDQKFTVTLSTQHPSPTTAPDEDQTIGKAAAFGKTYPALSGTILLAGGVVAIASAFLLGLFLYSANQYEDRPGRWKLVLLVVIAGLVPQGCMWLKCGLQGLRSDKAKQRNLQGDNAGRPNAQPKYKGRRLMIGILIAAAIAAVLILGLAYGGAEAVELIAGVSVIGLIVWGMTRWLDSK
jgi:hypothetical protein